TNLSTLSLHDALPIYAVAKEANAGNQGEVLYNDEDDIPDEEDENQSGQNKLSKKKRKMLNKLSIAELKALVKKPEVVEWHDTSSDRKSTRLNSSHVEI